MKKIISLSLATALSLSSISAQAGFLSTFFANVASDSLQSKGGRYSSDPLIKEKKIQGALAVLSLYEGKLDGDFDSFESRVAIKKFQKENNLEETGFLSDIEKSQLTYLSNLYVDINKPNIKESKKIALYNEIDVTLESMKSESFFENYVPFFAKGRILIISDLEDSDVFIDGKKVGKTLLGYYRQPAGSGEYSIKLESITPQGLWSYKGTKEVSVSGGEVSSITLNIENSKSPTDRQAALKKSSSVLFDSNSGTYFLDNTDIRFDHIQNAKEYCKNLNIEGVSNWRVTTSDELKTAFSLRKKFKDYNKISKHQRQWNWSSTEGSRNDFYIINFGFEHLVDSYDHIYKNHYRCAVS